MGLFGYILGQIGRKSSRQLSHKSREAVTTSVHKSQGETCCARHHLLPPPRRGYAITSVCLSFCLSVCRITAKVINRFHWNLMFWLGLPVGRAYSGSLLHFPCHCGIGYFRIFFSHSHWPIFRTLGEMTDADKVKNPQHFGNDPADIRIRIRIRIADHIWLRFLRLGRGLHCLNTV